MPGEAAGESETPRVTTAEPPAPDAVFTIVNPVMSLLLRSPFHSLVSDSLLLLRFTGRKTGNEYTTPVGYRREGTTLYVTTHSPWWRNLRDSAPVEVCLHGEWYSGTAKAHPDPEVVADHVHDVLLEEGIGVARRMGIEIEGETVPDYETLIEGIEGTILISIELDDG